MPAFSTADPNAYIALGMQTALGAPQITAAKTRFLKYISGNQFNLNMDIVDLREGGDGLDYGSSYKKLIKAEGQLVGNLRPEIAGQVFQFLPGAATWSGASAPAVHTFSTIGASFPYGTIRAAYPGTSIMHLLSDVRFTGLTIEGQKGEPLKFTLPWSAMTFGASDAGIVPTYYGEQYFLFHQNPSYLLGGAADSTIDSFKIDLKLGVEELQAQSVDLDDIVVMNREIDIEVTRRYQSPTLWQTIYYNSGVSPTPAIATSALDVSVQYGGGASLSFLRFVAPLISLRSGALTELDPDGKTVYETISGRVLKGATSALIATVNNQHASAYAP